MKTLKFIVALIFAFGVNQTMAQEKKEKNITTKEELKTLQIDYEDAELDENGRYIIEVREKGKKTPVQEAYPNKTKWKTDKKDVSKEAKINRQKNANKKDKKRKTV